MKKIVITSFVMPHELDDLERVLIDLNKASKHIDGDNYEFYISFSVSDYLFDWENSKVDKQFFIDRFNSLKSLTDWAGKSTYQIRDEIIGALQTKRYAHLECKDATHFIWLDTDICFDERILFYMENAIDVIDNVDKYFITPEIVKYWDTTWDCLVNSNYLNKPLDYCKTNNPFPESMGAYGPDDTFLMWGIEKLNQSGANIHQFKLKNYIVCENYIYRNRTHYDSIIKRIDRKEEFKKQSYSVFQKELNKIN